MNPKNLMYGGLVVGVVGATVSVSGFFDGQLQYCQITPTGCVQRSVPDWVALNQLSVRDVRRVPGSAVIKILGGLASAVGFGISMSNSRFLAQEELEAIEYRAIQHELGLRKAGVQAQIELEYFRRQAMLEGAEAVSGTFEPYQEAIREQQAKLQGETLEQVIDPSTKLEPGKVDSELAKFELETETEPKKKQDSVIVPKLTSKHGCELFDWNRFRTHPDEFAHIRIIGKTGRGKTVLADWLLDVLGGENFVITIKRRRRNWRGLKVYGLPRDYEACRRQLKWVIDEMDNRFKLLERDIEPEMINFVVDEWRSISQNVKQVKDSAADKIISLSAKEMMKEIITLARDAKLRLIALAQGKQVRTWGLEDESDLEECFTTIFLGQFAIEEAQAKRNSFKKDSEEYQHWSEVLRELKDQGVRCCLVEDMPAVVPDLSNWHREGTGPENLVERTKEMLEEYWNLEGFSVASENSDDEDDDDSEEIDDSPSLSDKAQKLFNYLRRRIQESGQEWISIREVQRREPIKGANSKEIECLFKEITDAGLGELNAKGDISLF